MVEKQKPPTFSESDRAELDAFIDERERQKIIDAFLANQAEHRKRRIESVRGWASLFTLIVGVFTLAFDKLAALWKYFIAWAAGA